jgi:hypothetical protein
VINGIWPNIGIFPGIASLSTALFFAPGGEKCGQKHLNRNESSGSQTSRSEYVGLPVFLVNASREKS